MDATVVTSPAGEPARHSIVYDGRGGAVGRLALKNVLLTIATLGIYRFWAKTRMRRYLWGHVSFQGERFEYAGTGGELFLGFLIVLAFFVVFAGTYTVLIIVALADSPDGQRAAELAYFTVIAFLYNYAVWRARRYRLSCSQWRGVRGGLTGSGWAYAMVAFRYYFLLAFTLGLIYPWGRFRLNKILMENSWFGDRRFAFEGTARTLLPAWLAVYIPVVGLFAVLAVLGGLGVFDDGATVMGLQSMSPALVVVVAAATLVLYVRYRVKEFRYFAACTAFEGLGFEATLRTRSVLGRYLLFGALAVAAYFLVFMIAVGGAVGAAAVKVDSGAILVAFALLVLVILPVLSILRYVIVVHGLARRICDSLTIIGTLDVDAIVQSAEAKPARGEGLAEMLDVGAI